MTTNTHPVSDEHLAAYALNELGAVEAATVAAHLAVCPQCLERIVRLRIIYAALLDYGVKTPLHATLARAEAIFGQPHTTLQINRLLVRLAEMIRIGRFLR
ncbi:MAG TPA: zf-HC2 domain-containing protein [Anaerolineae bacterium]|nr:zf-HC2 domain-containing protein [Anaerolineae bacterium]